MVIPASSELWPWLQGERPDQDERGGGRAAGDAHWQQPWELSLLDT